MDFGSAKEIRSSTKSVCGTPSYTAPEVILGHGYDFRADIWSLGICLYEMYYGISPFYDSDVNVCYQRILQSECGIPSFKASPELVNLLQLILVKNPDDRISIIQIKSHKWLCGIRWDKIFELNAPEFDHDLGTCQTNDSDQVALSDDDQKLFDGF